MDKYINLDNSCWTRKGKEEVRDLLYEYKDAFSLSDEIGICPNIKEEIDVTDKTLFFIRPFHAKEEDKVILNKEMKRLFYLGILKEGFSTYSSPVMLNSRKMTQDKKVVTDFRHSNMCIAKNNLAYLLLKDTFTLLGSSRCEVLSVLDLKYAFHSLRLTKIFQKVLCNSSISWKFLLFTSKDAYGFKHFPCNLAVLHQCNFRLFAK